VDPVGPDQDVARGHAPVLEACRDAATRLLVRHEALAIADVDPAGAGGFGQGALQVTSHDRHARHTGREAAVGDGAEAFARPAPEGEGRRRDRARPDHGVEDAQVLQDTHPVAAEPEEEAP